MKPLPKEIEIKKVFDNIKEVSNMKVPEMYMVTLEPIPHGRRGYCSDVGEIGINLVNIKHKVCENEQFVRTVCHEIVHYNHWDLGHSREFFAILEDLLNKVLNNLRQKGVKIWD